MTELKIAQEVYETLSDLCDADPALMSTVALIVQNLMNYEAYKQQVAINKMAEGGKLLGG